MTRSGASGVRRSPSRNTVWGRIAVLVVVVAVLAVVVVSAVGAVGQDSASRSRAVLRTIGHTEGVAGPRAQGGSEPAAQTCGTNGLAPCDPACPRGPGIPTCPTQQVRGYYEETFVPASQELWTYPSEFFNEYVTPPWGYPGLWWGAQGAPGPAYHPIALQQVTSSIDNILAPLRKSPPKGKQLTTLLTDNGLFLAYEHAGLGSSTPPKGALTLENDLPQLDRIFGLSTTSRLATPRHWTFNSTTGVILSQPGLPWTQIPLLYASTRKLTSFHPKALQAATEQIDGILTKYLKTANATHKGLTLSALVTREGLFWAWTNGVNTPPITPTVTTQAGCGAAATAVPCVLGDASAGVVFDVATVTSSADLVGGKVALAQCYTPNPGPPPPCTTPPPTGSGFACASGTTCSVRAYWNSAANPITTAGWYCDNVVFSGNTNNASVADNDTTTECVDFAVAAPGTVRCGSITGSMNFAPALTNTGSATSETITWTAHIPACTASDATVPSTLTGTVSGTTTLTGANANSCNTIFADGPTTLAIGSTSTATVNWATPPYAPTVVPITGWRQDHFGPAPNHSIFEASGAATGSFAAANDGFIGFYLTGPTTDWQTGPVSSACTGGGLATLPLGTNTGGLIAYL